jgi:hypothetical protein
MQLTKNFSSWLKNWDYRTDVSQALGVLAYLLFAYLVSVIASGPAGYNFMRLMRSQSIMWAVLFLGAALLKTIVEFVAYAVLGLPGMLYRLLLHDHGPASRQ